MTENQNAACHHILASFLRLDVKQWPQPGVKRLVLGGETCETPTEQPLLIPKPEREGKTALFGPGGVRHAGQHSAV